jgi:enoyl-[acyl-carrier-protein] reductase (NADH)
MCAAKTSSDALFDEISDRWGQLDTILHSIAFSKKDDLHGRVVDCSADGFGLAMDISVHSFLRLIRRAEPLMPHGGTCMTVSFMGAQKVVENYGFMGPVKAALEAADQVRGIRTRAKRHLRSRTFARTAENTGSVRHCRV